MIQDIMGDYTEQGMGDAHQDVMTAEEMQNMNQDVIGRGLQN
jgi:hypothetical protein